MDQNRNKERQFKEATTDADREDAVRRSLDEQGGGEKFDPRGGEDPGLLESTEDPHERRLKRNTM